jgi:hypothetical protein
MAFDGHIDTQVLILLDARALLARRGGWCQRANHENKNGIDRYCMLGAIQVAACRNTTPSTYKSEGKAVINAVMRAIGEDRWGATSLIIWNDARNRRKQQVLKILDRAMGYLVAAR